MDFQQLFGELRSAKEANDTMRVASIAHQMRALSINKYQDQAQHIVDQYIQGKSMISPYTIQRLEAVKRWTLDCLEFNMEHTMSALRRLATTGSTHDISNILDGHIPDEDIKSNAQILMARGELLLRKSKNVDAKVVSEDIRDAVWSAIYEYELQQQQND